MEQRKNEEYEKLLSQARFLALQSQINPHFLFNTLNSINRTVMLGRREQALTMLDSLSVLLRYNLADAQMPALLGEELGITEEYLKIQKMRFSSRLNVDVRHDRKLEQAVTLPRFTLQPLVENAVIHGLEPKEEGGNPYSGCQKDGKLYKDTDLRQWNGYGKGTPGEDQEASFGETAGTDWSLEYMAEAFLIYGQG